MRYASTYQRLVIFDRETGGFGIQNENTSYHTAALRPGTELPTICPFSLRRVITRALRGEGRDIVNSNGILGTLVFFQLAPMAGYWVSVPVDAYPSRASALDPGRPNQLS